MDPQTKREIETLTGVTATEWNVAVFADDAADIPWSSWTERMIASGRLSPGARGMDPADAADQYNQVNALTLADPDFMYAPSQAQRVAREVLRGVGIKVSEHVVVTLTDTDDTGMRLAERRLNPGQIEGAVEEHRLATGEPISADALVASLPWS